MASYTSTKSGNWSDTTVWGGGGPPVAGDTVTIAVTHTVTITGADAACLTLTLNGSSTTYGALGIGTGWTDVRTLTIGSGTGTANMTVVGTWSGVGTADTVTLGEGSSLVFNPGLGNTSTLTLGDVTHYSCSRLHCYGTAAHRCTVGLAAGGAGTVQIISGGNGNGYGFLNAAYTDFLNLGQAGSATADYGINCTTPNYSGVTNDFIVDHCTFQNSGLTYVSANAANCATASVSLTNCVWTGSLGTDAGSSRPCSLYLKTYQGNGTTGLRYVHGNTFDSGVSIAPDGYNYDVQYNVFKDGLYCYPASPTLWTAIQNNFISGSIAPAQGSTCHINGPLTTNYIWLNDVTNMNWHAISVVGVAGTTIPISGVIFEACTGADGNSYSGVDHDSMIWTQATGTNTVRNCLSLPGPARLGSGGFVSNVPSTPATVSIEHVTQFCPSKALLGVGNEGPYYGETTNVEYVNNLLSYKANLCWADTSATGVYKLHSIDTPWSSGAYNTGAKATVAVTGGGSTGGSLAAGSYYVGYTYVDNAGKETALGGSVAPGTTVSSQFTVASGNIPQVTLTAPSGGFASANIYVSLVGGANTALKQYATGVTGSTYNLSAASTGSTAPPALTAIGDPIDFIAAANCDYNAGYHLISDGVNDLVYLSNQVSVGSAKSGYNNMKFSGATGPGVHDVDGQAPGFVDSTRSLATWAVTQGSVSATYMGQCADAITYLSANPSVQIPALIAWVQAGFVPTNAAMNFTYPGDSLATDAAGNNWSGAQNVGAMYGEFAPGNASGSPATLLLAAPSGSATGSPSVYSYAYIDNTDTGCTLVGTWHPLSYLTQQYGTNFDYSNSSTAKATYTFTGLLANVPVTIAGTWIAQSNQTTAAPYTVYDSNGTSVIGTFAPNQQNVPTADWTYPADPNNRPFQILGTVTPTGTSLSVVISANTPDSKYVIADCVSIRQSDPSVATGYTVTNPESLTSAIRVASGNFAVTPTGGPFTGTITPQSSGEGAFAPASLTWYGTSDTKTFTYIPQLSGGSPHQITTTNTAGLTDPSTPISYTVTTSETLVGLSSWQTRQLTAINGCTNFPAYTVGINGGLPDLAGSEHYDPVRIGYQVWDYRVANSLSTTGFSDFVSTALTRFRDWCVLAKSGRLSPILIHNFTAGCFRDYYTTGSIDSRDAVLMLYLGWNAYNTAYWTEWYAQFWVSRESAFSLAITLDCERIGMPIGQLADVLAGWQLQIIDQWLTPAPRPYPLVIESFMVGLTYEALILYWDRYQGDTSTATLTPGIGVSSLYNTRVKILAAIPGKIKAMLDYQWENTWVRTGAWDSANAWNCGGFQYYDRNVATDLAPISSTVVAGTDHYTFTGPSTLSTQDDYYKWGLLNFTSGANTSATNYNVIGYTGSTRTFHLGLDQTPPYVPSTGDGFTITPDIYEGDPTGTNAVASGLNNLIGPAYAWYYWYTANILGTPDISYREKHDAIFDGSWGAYNDPISQKDYNQEYRWAPQGLTWRARGDTEWDAATTYTLTAPSSASGQANAPSGIFTVALPANTVLASPLILTPTSSTGNGTFIPATVVLSSDHPFGLFRFVPSSLDSGPVDVTAPNASGLTAPDAVSYTVGSAATIASSRTITGPSSGFVGVPATFTLTTVPDGAVMPVAWLQATGGIDSMFANDGADQELWNMPNPGPTYVIWFSSERLSQAFTYTPATIGVKAMTFTQDSLGLPEIDLSFTAETGEAFASGTAPSVTLAAPSGSAIAAGSANQPAPTMHLLGPAGAALGDPVSVRLFSLTGIGQ